MTFISDLPAALAEVLNGEDVIVFDGECVLCSGFFRFMLSKGRAERFRFVLAQSELGTQVYQALGLPVTDYETNLVMVDGRIYGKLDAFAAAMRAVGGPWRILSGLRFLPQFIKDPAYGLIARNRYRIFGRYPTCMLPDENLRARFLPGGWE
ncbi:thiol-disulfide oxidoreductase DCC family protein [Roseovarius sp. 2305UL8-3]|uniref:thiol-disulfide oxidoreductase DCC family protein n=1 Tax=Roseovarius conchicola TaxID=3121636 RepID=UPI003528C5B0